MSDTPSTNNATATAINQLIHDAIFEVAVALVETGAEAEVPLLATPVVNLLFHTFVDYIAGKFYTVLAQLATFAVIDSQTSNEQKAMILARDQLIQAQTSGDQNATDAAKQAFKKALANLVHFDGSTNVQLCKSPNTGQRVVRRYGQGRSNLFSHADVAGTGFE